MFAGPGGPSFLALRSSSRIIISVLRDDRTAGVAKTVPPLPWLLNWVREGDGRAQQACSLTGKNPAGAEVKNRAHHLVNEDSRWGEIALGSYPSPGPA